MKPLNLPPIQPSAPITDDQDSDALLQYEQMLKLEMASFRRADNKESTLSRARGIRWNQRLPERS